MPEPTVATEVDLVARAASGDHAAFNALFERYVDPVHDHVVRWSRDTALAADATAEAFVTLLRELDGLRDGQAVLPWLLRAARTRAVEQLRRTPGASTEPDATASSSVLAATVTPADTPPEDAALTHETAELVWGVAAELDDRSFTALDLSVRRGLSDAEVAAVMATSPAEAEALVQRARGRMRTLLGAIDPLPAYGGLAVVRAPVAVRSAVGAATIAHFGPAGGLARLRRGAVGAILVGLLLLLGGIAYGLRGPSTTVGDGPPTVAAEPVLEPSPMPSTTLAPLPPASPLPVAPPEPTVAPSVEPSPSPSPSPSPLPQIALAISIDAPPAGASVTADSIDPETDRSLGTVPVAATVAASSDAQVIVAWSSDLAPDTILHTGTDGAVELWLESPCADTTHQLRATATDTTTGDTATAVVPVTMTHTCNAPDVEVTKPEDEVVVTADQLTAEGTYAATVDVAAKATPNDAKLTWAWTSDRMDGELLTDASGQIQLTVECGGDPVTHTVTATATATDGSTDSDQVKIVVEPPPGCI